MISVYYFRTIGFVIIPISTTISSWFNALILLLYLSKKDLFKFNEIFVVRFFKIIFSSLMMGIFFNYLMKIFENQLIYSSSLKSIYLILSVLLGLMFYLMLSFFIKAFNYQDVKLKY